MQRVFPAKVSWWLFGPILGFLIGGAVVGFAISKWPLAIILLSTAAFTGYVVLGTRYTLTEAELRIQSGPFRWQVPIQRIKEIYPTRSPLSSPAPSLDRLHIGYDKYDSVLVSPRDQAEFVKVLKQLNPNIQLS